MDRTSLTSCPEIEAAEAVEAVEAVEVAEVAEGNHHLDPEEQDTERLSLPMWTTNCMDRALTSLQETSERPENFTLGETSTGVSTSTQQ